MGAVGQEGGHGGRDRRGRSGGKEEDGVRVRGREGSRGGGNVWDIQSPHMQY